MTGICEVTITAPSADWLADFTRRLVEDRLVACGHNVVEVRSIYRWRGDIEDEREARVMLHTRQDLVPAIVERTRNEHPYEVPCVISAPLTDANPDYREWILEETRQPG